MEFLFHRQAGPVRDGPHRPAPDREPRVRGLSVRDGGAAPAPLPALGGRAAGDRVAVLRLVAAGLLARGLAGGARRKLQQRVPHGARRTLRQFHGRRHPGRDARRLPGRGALRAPRRDRGRGDGGDGPAAGAAAFAGAGRRFGRRRGESRWNAAQPRRATGRVLPQRGAAGRDLRPPCGRQCAVRRDLHPRVLALVGRPRGDRPGQASAAGELRHPAAAIQLRLDLQRPGGDPFPARAVRAAVASRAVLAGRAALPADARPRAGGTGAAAGAQSRWAFRRFPHPRA